MHRTVHIWAAICLLAAMLAPNCSAQEEETNTDEQEALQLLVETISNVEEPDVTRALLRGMLRGLEGRRNVVAPQAWSSVAAKLDAQDDDRIRDLSMQLSQIFGDQDAVQRAMTIVLDQKAQADTRRKMLQALLSQKNRETSELLEGLLDDPDLQVQAVRGFAAVENKQAPQMLLKRFPAMDTELRRVVVETLASRELYAKVLVTALKEQTVAKEEIPTHVARSLSSMLGDQFESVFGKPPSLGADREKLIAEWKSRLSRKALAKASASRGRAVFQKTCAACHLLYGEGGTVGPDLTGSNRANLDYLLLNSVDPSYDVPEAYRTVSVLTMDGRVVNGVLAEEDPARIVLKTAEQPRVVIAKEDIEVRKVSPKSMMPDGQLDQLKRQEVIDLVKYLRTTEQVEISK